MTLVFQCRESLAAVAVELRTTPDRADSARRDALPPSRADARRPWTAGEPLEADELLDGDRAGRVRAQLAGRRARRTALLLPAHVAARDPRRPGAALLRRRHV